MEELNLDAALSQNFQQMLADAKVSKEIWQKIRHALEQEDYEWVENDSFAFNQEYLRYAKTKIRKPFKIGNQTIERCYKKDLGSNEKKETKTIIYIGPGVVAADWYKLAIPDCWDKNYNFAGAHIYRYTDEATFLTAFANANERFFD